MSEKRKYDSTVARIAGNILSGTPNVCSMLDNVMEFHAAGAVRLARFIVAEVEKTEPREKPYENGTLAQADKNR